MPFDIQPTRFPGLLVVQPTVFRDARGFFLESFHAGQLAAAGLASTFVQDNLSRSTRGTVRGLHYQAPPYAQAKLVSVVQGQVLDVAVDIRVGSPTYGQTYLHELSDENATQLYIPEGFAHGFAVLSETAIFAYKCTAYYHKPSEGGLAWDDPALGIDWQVANTILSDKDLLHPKLTELVSPFLFASVLG